MKDRHILEYLSSLPFFDVMIKTMREGNFMKPVNPLAPHKDSQSLGEITYMEKVFFSISARSKEEHQKLLESSTAEKPETQKKLKELKSMSDTAFDYLITNITGRLRRKWSKLGIEGMQNVTLVFHPDFTVTYKVIDKGPKPEPEAEAAQDVSRPVSPPPSVKLPGNKTVH
jgi:hypothetical protein